jgi:hypothetical protein
MPDTHATSADHPPDPASGVKPHVMVVGHHVGDNLFGAERSLLDVLAAIDRRRFDLSCVLPSSNEAYLRAVAERTRDVTVFSYQWWSKERPFDGEAVSRFESLFARKRVDLVHVNTMTLMDPLLAAKRLGLPGIVHARELFDQDRELMRRFGEDARAVLNRIHAATDFVIANSDATHRLFYRREESFRLYNGIDVARFDLPNDLVPGRLKIGLISSNGAKKGIDSFAHLAHMATLRRARVLRHRAAHRADRAARAADACLDGAGESALSRLCRGSGRGDSTGQCCPVAYARSGILRTDDRRGNGREAAHHRLWLGSGPGAHPAWTERVPDPAAGPAGGAGTS